MSGARVSDESIQRAAAVILAANGITIHRVSLALGLSLGYTKNVLGRASKAGMVACIQTARREVKWYAPEKAAAILARQKATTAAGRAERRRVAKLRSQAKRRGHDASDWQWRELADKPQRSMAPAGSPLPFVCRAPNSVFAMGAAA